MRWFAGLILSGLFRVLPSRAYSWGWLWAILVPLWRFSGGSSAAFVLDYQGPRRALGECAPPLPAGDEGEAPEDPTEDDGEWVPCDCPPGQCVGHDG